MIELPRPQKAAETEAEETRTAESEAAGAEQPEGAEEGGLVSNATPTGAGEPVANSGPSLTLSYSRLTIGVKEKCRILTATLGEENSGDTVTWMLTSLPLATFFGW